MQRRLAAVILGIAISAVTANVETAAAISDTSCRGDIALVRVRGSGDVRGTDQSLNRTGNEGNTGSQLTLDAASLVFRERAAQAGKTVNEYDLAYPALSTRAIGSDLKHLQIWDSTYLDSARQGRENLATLLPILTSCGTRPIALMGYSQGAWIVGDVLVALDPNTLRHVSAVAVFGDPAFDPTDPAASGSFDPTRHGIAGKRRIGDVLLDGRGRSFCYYDDVVCQGLNASTKGALAFGRKTLATSVVKQQAEAHARGYACDGISSDSVCRIHLESRKASLARKGGTFLADQLGLHQAATVAKPD